MFIEKCRIEKDHSCAVSGDFPASLVALCPMGKWKMYYITTLQGAWGVNSPERYSRNVGKTLKPAWKSIAVLNPAQGVTSTTQ